MTSFSVSNLIAVARVTRIDIEFMRYAPRYWDKSICAIVTGIDVVTFEEVNEFEVLKMAAKKYIIALTKHAFYFFKKCLKTTNCRKKLHTN